MATAAFAFFQTQRVQEQTREIAQLRDETKQREQQAKQDVEKIAALEQKTQILNAESATLREKLHAMSPTLAEQNPAPAVTEASPEEGQQPKDASNQLGGFLQKMFKDPEMKKAMAAQQSMAMRQFYTDFVKSAQLTPQQADAFFNLLSERQMKMMDKAGDMMKSGTGGMPAAAQDMSDETEAFNAQLKDLLGDARATQFKDYEKTLADRIALNQLNQQLSATGAPLSADQSKGLMQLIADERAKQPPSPLTQQPGNMKGLNMSDGEMQQFFQSQEDVNSRVRTRAMGILTPAQLQALENFQKQQIEMQKMGLKMAKQMFGTKGEGE